MLKGQSQAVVQPLTFLRGDPTLVQQQRPLEAVAASCGAHLAWRGQSLEGGVGGLLEGKVPSGRSA